MNILKINTLNNYQRVNFSEKNEKFEKKPECNNQKTCETLSYPSNYYINFTGEAYKTIGDLYNEREINRMPSLVVKYIEDNKAVAHRYDLKAIHKEVYAKLADCHTVEDIKQAFGDSEECFNELKELQDIEDGNNREQHLFYNIAQAQLQGKKVIDSDDDIVTYVVKQMFLECKEFNETIRSLKDVMTEDGKDLLKFIPEENASIGRKFFLPIGLKTPNGTTYCSALRRGAGKLSHSQELTKTLIQNDCLTADKLKLLKDKISLIDAWNHSPEIRKDLSHHMFYNTQSPAYAIKNEDFADIATLRNIYTDDFVKNRMSLLMEEFWESNPQHIQTFTDNIRNAKNKFDKMASVGGKEYQDYVKEVYRISDNERQKILELSANYKDPYATAKITLSRWLDKAKPLRLNTQETNNRIISLLFLRGALSQSEIDALQNDSQDPLFVKLTKAKKGEGGLIDKVASLSNDTTYRRMLNAQSFTIVAEVLEKSPMTQELKEAFESGVKLNEYTKKLIKGKLNQPPKDFNLDFISKQCKNNEICLNTSEQIDIAEYLFETYDFLKLEDMPKIRKVLGVQGKFLNEILGDNEQLKELSETIFWSEYERSTGVSVLPLVKEAKANYKLHEQKMTCIDAIDWSKLISSTWGIN